MARVSTYLNFRGTTEEAFLFYREAFGTEFLDLRRMGDVPSGEPLTEEEDRLVMHVALPTLGDHVLMGTDILESRGDDVTVGTNVSINLEPDTRAETERIFAVLADGGHVTAPLAEMFWGGYFGSLTDRYGVRWMFNCPE